MSDWCSVVPLHRLPLDVDQPIAFGGGLTLAPLPEWLQRDNMLDHLSFDEREDLKQTNSGFIVEYHANSLGDPDPSWKGNEPKSIQESKYELAVLANLALWLARPSPVCFTVVFHAPNFSGRWLIQQCQSHSPILCHPDDEPVNLSIDDIQLAAALHKSLCTIPHNNAIWTAIRSSWAGLQMGMEEVRYLLFWIALEALFGPEDAREITFRLSQRIALFLGNGQNEVRELFRAAKKCYSFRSKVAHGTWKENPKSIQLMAATERLIRVSFQRILPSDELKAVFVGKGRESYLDELAFTGVGTRRTEP